MKDKWCKHAEKTLTPNYAIKPTPEQALRPNPALPPARLIAALGVTGCTKMHEFDHTQFSVRILC